MVWLPIELVPRLKQFLGSPSFCYVARHHWLDGKVSGAGQLWP